MAEEKTRPRLLPEQLTHMRWVWSLGGLSIRELARRTGRAILFEDTLGRAAELSYYFLLSLFPFLICMSSIAGLVFQNNRELYLRALGYLEGVMPYTAYAIVRGAVNDLTSGAGGGKLSFAVIFTLWTASLGMDAVIKGLNVAYDVREFRPWWRRRLVAMIITAVLLALLILALLMILAGGWIGEWLARLMPGAPVAEAWTGLQLLLIVCFALLGLSLTYIFAPNVKEQRFLAIIPGAVVAFTCWVAASAGFRVYLRYFDSYAATYGSLGAVIVLLLWLYLSGAALMVGGEVNAQIRHAAAQAGSPEARKIKEATE
jgi:membrane protein